MSTPRRFFRLVLALGWLPALPLAAQSTAPAVYQSIPAQALTAGGSPATVGLQSYFVLPGVGGTVVQFKTVLGTFNAELLAAAAPINVANFLSYVNGSLFNNTFIHRSVPGFIVQGGGYYSTLPIGTVPSAAPVVLEANLPNTRGTLAMARTSDPNSATSQWFVNTVDNTTSLSVANTGGYSVIGRVLGSGMSVVDAIASEPIWNAGSPLDTLPLINYQSGSNVAVANFVTINSIATIPIYPVSVGGTAVLKFTVTNSAPSVVNASISASSLVLNPGTVTGSATVTVTATDTNGNTATTTVAVTVNPVAQTIAFTGPANQAFSTAPLALSATASSGLPVTFAVVSGPASITGSQLTINGVGQVTVSATQAGNGTYAAAPEVDRSFTVTANFASWQQSAFSGAELLDPTVSGPDAVYGADGLPNLVKYALGLNPKQNATANLPAVSMDQGNWIYTFSRPTAVTGVTCTVEVSTDLVTWTDLTPVSIASANGSETFEATCPVASFGNAIFRLVVTQ